MRLAYAASACLLLAGCSRTGTTIAPPAAKAFGSALTEVSGGKQAGGVGTILEQPLVVQVNDAQGSPVAGAAVWIRSAGGAAATPSGGLTGADGQFTANVSLGGAAGRYQVVAATRNSAGKTIELRIDEIALGYQETVGRELNDVYCSRCHDPESTPLQVSNHDNLSKPAHAFTDGATLNAMSDDALAAIIIHGGPGLNRSPEMPPYGYTLRKSDIAALMAYIRAVADPPYRLKGTTYAKN
jgi:mono/diheme cytochrome c family protein